MVYTSLSSKDGNYPYQLNIAHLYGNLMNTYGDNGNILMLKYVAEKLGAHVTVDIVSLHDDLMKITTTSPFSVVVKTLNKVSLQTTYLLKKRALTTTSKTTV
ncbi:cobyric acid synthase [Streptococcus pneumoniae]|nr:cobyric acid synthase [Streptococcus pneumoniae]